MKVKLRKGAMYWQDFMAWQWVDDDSPVFEVKEVLHGGNTLRIVAEGYGIHLPDDEYGVIFVERRHVSLVDEKKRAGRDVQDGMETRRRRRERRSVDGR